MNSINDRIESVDIDDDDDEAPIPGTVFNKRQARMLKYVVIFLGLLLIAGFALLIGIIAYRASQPGKPAAAIAPAGITVPQAGLSPQGTMSLATSTGAAGLATKNFEAMIPKGASHVDSTISGNRLVLTLQTRDGGLQLMLIDLHSWKIVGTARLNQQR